MRTGEIRMANGRLLFAEACRTETVGERIRGLLGRDRLAEQESLWIDRCDSVHTVAMRFPIDLAYVDAEGRVRKTVPAMRPGRMSICWRAQAAVEMAAGSLDRVGLACGDRIQFTERSADGRSS